MVLFSPDRNKMASPALFRLVEMIRNKENLTANFFLEIDWEQKAPKKLKSAIPRARRQSFLPFLRQSHPSDLPLDRLTVAGALLVRAMSMGRQEIKNFCECIAAQPHAKVPVAILPQKNKPFEEGLDLLQMMAQWRWRGQTSPFSIEKETSQMAFALQRNKLPGLDEDLGRSASWAVAHDWGSRQDGSDGMVAVHVFSSLVKVGAIVSDLNDLRFPDPFDRQGRVPVLLAIMRHAPQDQVVALVSTLIDQGADPNAMSSSGRTALMACMDRGLEQNASEIASNLLAKGADPDLKNKNGFTSLEQMNSKEKAMAPRVQRITPFTGEASTAFHQDPLNAIRSSLARKKTMSILCDIEKEMSEN